MHRLSRGSLEALKPVEISLLVETNSPETPPTAIGSAGPETLFDG